ncbi:MAG: patatin-like phospholipase family protein, partial [Gemmatimonadaceae bacterium]
LICAAQVGGTTIDQMTARARDIRRRDLFRVDRMGMLLERTHTPSIYLAEPLREVCESVVPDKRFDEIDATLLVNTVDLQRGAQVVWGLTGLRHVSILDSVYASCALPGFFPPGVVDGRLCVDGGVVDNLPVAVASQGVDAVIAVDTGSSALATDNDIATQGFPGIYMRAATTMMHALQLGPLERWWGPPMILIRPSVSHIGWFSFSHTDELIDAGYRAAVDALGHLDRCLEASSGIFPRRATRISVDREKCIGCTLCVSLAPWVMAMDEGGKATVKTPVVQWSPADGDFVHHCPTYAISAEAVEPGETENQPEAMDIVPGVS